MFSKKFYIILLMIIKLAHNNPTKIKPKQYLPKSKEPIFDKNVGILELNWKVPKVRIR